MKKILIYLLISLIMLTGCTVTDKKDDDRIKIITTVFPIYDFAKNICGDFADVTLIVPPGTDSHSFEPTPNDIINISKSDLFIYVGMESESWVKEVLNSIEYPMDNQLILGDIAEFNDIPDEHIWTSVKNASLICNKIKEKLCEIDIENSEKYNLNYEIYNGKLNELDNKFSEIINNSKRNTVVFGDRFPFLNFVSDYGLNYYSAFNSCSHETEPSAATVSDMINKINNEKIPVVFHIEFSNENIANILCENTGAKKLLFHSCHTVTEDEIENGVNYIDLMNKNSENLKEALN